MSSGAAKNRESTHWYISLVKYLQKNKKAASANAEASCFSRFEDLRPPYLGKTNLADTKYCVPLRLHRQSDIRMADGGGSRHIMQITFLLFSVASLPRRL